MNPIVIHLAVDGSAIPVGHIEQIAGILAVMADGYRHAAGLPNTPPDACLQLFRDAQAFDRAVQAISGKGEG